MQNLKIYDKMNPHPYKQEERLIPMANNTKKQTGKTKKSNPLITAAYVVGIALAVGGYVFADASGYLIPGLSPFALAAVIGVYTYEHYQNNKANRDGMLMPQMITLGMLAAVNVFWGALQIYAVIVS